MPWAWRGGPKIFVFAQTDIATRFLIFDDDDQTGERALASDYVTDEMREEIERSNWFPVEKCKKIDDTTERVRSVQALMFQGSLPQTEMAIYIYMYLRIVFCMNSMVPQGTHDAPGGL